MAQRTIVFGDIHGCRQEFEMLLAKVGFVQGQDRVILAGDLVDRGNDSPGVIRLAIKIGAEAVSGNHDDKLLRRYRHFQRAQRDRGYKVPMRPSEDQEATLRALTTAEILWLSCLPTYIVLPEFDTVVLHAGVQPGRPVEEQPREVLTMMRYMDPKTNRMVHMEMPGFRQPKGSVYWAERYDGADNIIFGHNVVSRKDHRVWTNARGARCYGIDTGCCFGGRLTCAILEEGQEIRFEQVNALQEYHPYGGPASE